MHEGVNAGSVSQVMYMRALFGSLEGYSRLGKYALEAYVWSCPVKPVTIRGNEEGTVRMCNIVLPDLIPVEDILLEHGFKTLVYRCIALMVVLRIVDYDNMPLEVDIAIIQVQRLAYTHRRTVQRTDQRGD